MVFRNKIGLLGKFGGIMDITIPTQFADHAQITVFGVGGAGGNALEHMISNKLTDVTFVCATPMLKR